jgi:hypothetical protein
MLNAGLNFGKVSALRTRHKDRNKNCRPDNCVDGNDRDRRGIFGFRAPTSAEHSLRRRCRRPTRPGRLAKPSFLPVNRGSRGRHPRRPNLHSLPVFDHALSAGNASATTVHAGTDETSATPACTGVSVTCRQRDDRSCVLEREKAARSGPQGLCVGQGHGSQHERHRGQSECECSHGMVLPLHGGQWQKCTIPPPRLQSSISERGGLGLFEVAPFQWREA